MFVLFTKACQRKIVLKDQKYISKEQNTFLEHRFRNTKDNQHRVFQVTPLSAVGWPVRAMRGWVFYFKFPRTRALPWVTYKIKFDRSKKSNSNFYHCKKRIKVIKFWKIRRKIDCCWIWLGFGRISNFSRIICGTVLKIFFEKHIFDCVLAVFKAYFLKENYKFHPWTVDVKKMRIPRTATIFRRARQKGILINLVAPPYKRPQTGVEYLGRKVL